MYVCFSFLKESLTFVGNTKLVSLAIINKTKYTKKNPTACLSPTILPVASTTNAHKLPNAYAT